ncbi:hypothetical protein KIF53_17600 [Chromobacterium subtsugae]|uniref:Secreted protein n=1 Tax=Chromobacterium subtsugae TaxID=251747 RepID=A0ABS7FJG1_9NEIS|nr:MULTISPECIES: hypothetical protein [Chromobacterium]KUM03683.1 hypothetical protein Cv017_00815 [Chromobacterium subtsugae]KZE88333.1 hypothetical protein AWB61_00175 [Chromobacterium sp. F49]MBW7568717.1 hypothetical protein [Chromobacterium subtsugae]MBW8289453.1 hypothetical protein [Chromobacterium subtsugae]OBU85920.1 hypothetical protein MY55_14000 [Chromobacterium subtsugae]
MSGHGYWAAAIALAAILSVQAASAADAAAGQCRTLTDIEGRYRCAGECVTTAADGSRSLVKVSGEEDAIRRFDGSQWIYQIDITGSGGFAETEIGGLSGHVLQTATAHVSDQQYPVLEEYAFAADDHCRATGYVKTVRNPDPVALKACSLACSR